jgi:hypothetical protein
MTLLVDVDVSSSTQPFDGVWLAIVSTMIFMAKVRGLSTICKVMPVSTHVVFMPGII